MALNSSSTPYSNWVKEKSTRDYRDRTTQNTSYVRGALSQDRYLRERNRVNSGPGYKTRVQIAKASDQLPHVYGTMKMWGWQSWASRSSTLASNYVTGLFEASPTPDVSGANYLPYTIISGDQYVYSPDALASYESEIIEVGSPITITPSSDITSIDGLSVNTDQLDPEVADPTANYVMIYDSTTNSFKFVDSGDLIGLLDGDGNPDTIDFGGYA